VPVFEGLPGFNMGSMKRTQLALNTELALSPEGKAPTWLELIPAANTAGNITGRDGRTWVWDAAAQRDVLNEFNRREVDIALDWEHATQHRAANGEEAPAAGWIDQLELRNGALMGRVQWTPRGREQVQNREYRYVSPVFDYVPDSKRIARMVSVGLTNTPNLRLSALNHEESPMPRSSELAAGIAALGLKPDADDAAIATAINTLKTERDSALVTAKNAEQPTLERYVPRAEYDTLKARAENAEQTLKQRDEAAHKAAVDTAIEGAVKAGKIAPVNVEYYRAQCKEADGLKQFQEFVKSAPVIGGDSGLAHKTPTNTNTALNHETLAAKAQAYQAEQRKAGIEISTAAAVRHIEKETLA